MSYPQPSADDYSLSGSEFFRLFTPLTSPGDIYESTVGGYAFALGPESDVSNVNVAYFDPQVSGNMNTTTIGPRRSFSGLIYADNTQLYVPANRPGRILLWPSDLYDPSYYPSGISPGEVITFVPPILDVIQYLTPQPNLSIKRNDKTYRFYGVPSNQQQGFFIMPFWGRKSFRITLLNQNTHAITVAITGLNYFANPNRSAIETRLVSGGIGNENVPAGGNLSYVLTASSTNGAIFSCNFDAMQIFIGHGIDTPDGNTPMTITVSDEDSPPGMFSPLAVTMGT